MHSAQELLRRHGKSDEQIPNWTPQSEPAPAPPLSLANWLTRDLPSSDLLLPWLSTTSRVLIAAFTGIGKTMFGIGLGMAAADGSGFLHWRGVRPARVLFIDGEMSRRLLQQRLIDEAARLGVSAEGFHVLSHEDVENFRPLNTPEGQAFIERIIERIGGVDLIEFDNVMSLLAGNMKETEPWAATMPWVRSLTRRNIGQIWMHHTNEEKKSYGDKTREWQMDTVIFLEELKRADTDVSFQLTFAKARERTPANRAAFADARIALVDNQWTSDAIAATARRKVSPLAMKFHDALVNATIGNNTPMQFNCPTTTLDEWRAECSKIGLLEKDIKARGSRSLFDKYKRELIAGNWAACNETVAWIIN